MAAAVRDPMGAEEEYDLVADDDLVAAFEAQPRRPNNQAAAPIAMMVTSKMMYELMVCYLACVCSVHRAGRKGSLWV